jgi:hypothetical protein
VRDAEVGDLHAAVGPHQDVPGLHVAVDHPRAVRLPETERRLPEQGQGGRGVEPALPREKRRERLALDQLHDQVGQRLAGAVLGYLLAVVEDGGDVRVAERGGVLGLGPEAGDERRVAGVLAAQHLDRDRPVQRDVVSAPHLAHAAGGDQLVQFVTVTQAPSSWFDHGGHSSFIRPGRVRAATSSPRGPVWSSVPGLSRSGLAYTC